MNFLININVCRVCMENEQSVDLCSDSDIKEMFTYTTRLTISEKDNLPKSLCSKCMLRLKVANKFIKTAHESENNLKQFLAKISNEFKEVTHGKKFDNSTDKDNILDDDEDNLTMNDMILIVEDDESSTRKTLTKPTNNNNAKSPEKRKYSPAKANESKRLKLESISSALSVSDTSEVEVTAEANDESENFMKVNGVYSLDNDIFLIHSESNDIEFDNITNFGDQDEQSQDTVEQSNNENEQVEEKEDIENSQEDINENCQLTLNNGSKKKTYANSTKVVAKKEQHLHNLPNLIELNEKNKRLESLEENSNHMQNEVSSSQVGYLKQYGKMLSTNQVNVIQYNEDYDLEENLTEDLQFIDATQSEDTEMIVENVEEERSHTDNPVPVAFSSATAAQRNENRSKLMPRKDPQYPHKSQSLNRFYCEQCNRDFSTKTNLNRHMQSHEGNKPHTCRECGKSFTQKSTLKQHMYTHTGEKPHICDVCNRGFTQCKSLIFHMRRHTGEKPFQCEYCSIMFRQKDALRIHILKHHVITEQQANGVEILTCIICQTKFETKSDFKMHMKSHTATVESIEMITSDATEQGFLKASRTNSSHSSLNDENLDVAIMNLSASSAAEPRRAKKISMS